MGKPWRSAQIPGLTKQLDKTEENGGFNSEKVTKIQSLLGLLEKPSGMCSLALSGKPPFLFELHTSDKSFVNS